MMVSLTRGGGARRIALLVVSAGLALGGAAPAKLLLPLSEKDIARVNESGCEFAFGRGDTSYVYAINQTLLIRTPQGGAATCTIPSERMNAFQDSGGKLSCGDIELSMKRTGTVTGYEEADSSQWPAALTVRHTLRKQQVVLRGTAGVAC